MTTAMSTFSAVAAELGGIDPADEEAVDSYFADTLAILPEPARDLIFGWLLEAPDNPSSAQLEELHKGVLAELRLAGIVVLPSRTKDALPIVPPVVEFKQAGAGL